MPADDLKTQPAEELIKCDEERRSIYTRTMDDLERLRTKASAAEDDGKDMVIVEDPLVGVPLASVAMVAWRVHFARLHRGCR